jgi:NAD(P)H-dependent FMN reductase
MRILAICGSLQARSSNMGLLQAAAALAPTGVEVVLFDGLRDLPQFNPDLEANALLPVVEAWRQALSRSDAFQSVPRSSVVRPSCVGRNSTARWRRCCTSW